MRIHLQEADIYFLEYKSPFSWDNLLKEGYYMELQDKISPEEYLRIYEKIGRPWHWSERLLMSYNQLLNIIESQDTLIYFLLNMENVVGFFEMNIANKEAELVYFGLDKAAMGKGLGKILMNNVLAVAQEHNLNRLWLHTCSFDSPVALRFYQKSGFNIYHSAKGWEKHIF